MNINELLKHGSCRSSKATSRHTPGPWNYRYEGSGDYEVYAESTKDEIGSAWSKDAHFLGFGSASEQNESNARLIAAAPDLLAACKAVMACKYNPELQDPTVLVSEAIVKAESTQP